MLIAAFLLYFAIPTQRVWALKVAFPSPPTAAQNNTFLWTQEDDDPDDVWLRTQRLDDTGATSWSDNTVHLDLSHSAGRAQIHFDRAGLFNVGAFESEDNPNHDHKVPISITQATVSVNPTSAGAISGTSEPVSFIQATVSMNSTSAGTISGTSSSVSSSTSVGSPSTSMPSEEKNGAKQRPKNVAVIVGLTVGFITLGIIGAIILYFNHYRRRWKTDMTPPIVTPFSDTTGYNITRTDIKERQKQLFGQRERRKRQSRVYEQAPQTSAANNQTDDTGIDQLRDTMQELRHQVDIVTQRMGALEAGTARPPDYSPRVRITDIIE
ncbi:hypothetical protein E1B28_013093 [Marasmius oreades]|uniref:Mid2 domain-containing protein n=1 Tax=Marasmius oreades TaxID=181124 RepID=A0A9P7RPJ0_9AGAR|nr:uncharacterized protein E1B28_013093 [Marasmius oreades]KAG7087112.1 hypothetical protein E1B28_013093 [Marasmius oreades]